MKKFLCLAVALLTAAGAFAGEIAKGYVYEDVNGNGRKDGRDRGIAGVLVSDGQQIVQTDAKGRWQMEVDDHCVIFVIKPRGYISPLNEFLQPKSWYIHKPAGSPELKFAGSAPTGKLPKSLDFALVKFDDPENFKFFVFGDPQPYSMKEMQYFHDGIVAEASQFKGPVFGISLGDIVGERMDLYGAYLEAIKDMGVPWYNVIGNHDRNYDCVTEEYANESFEASFGPSTVAFQYGRVHFIMLDDIFMNNAPKANPYIGGFSEEQFRFLEAYEKYIPKDDLIIFGYHIPFNFKPGQFDSQMRERFFKIFEGHKIFGLSAHSHIQQQLYCGPEEGWHGEKPYHEYNVGTSNGDWYSGRLGPDGTPTSTMRDGTEKGYAVVTITGTDYIFDYKVTNHPWEYQMSVYGTPVVPYNHGSKYPVYANFFIGAPDAVVEFRIDGGKWAKMKHVTDEFDPYFLMEKVIWDQATEAMDGRRPDSLPFLCNHLWKGVVDNKLEPGIHHVDIRAKDIFGRTHKAVWNYRIEEVK